MRTILTIIPFALICSCNKSASLPAYSTDPVVSAYLYAGHPFGMQLTHQQSTSSQTYYAPSLDSLDVTVQCGDSVYHLTPAPNGMYSDSALFIEPGNTYTLSFAYNGKTVTATTTAPHGGAPPPAVGHGRPGILRHTNARPQRPATDT